MKEVARRAGVSVTTVSHIINSTRFVSPELTERVLAAIDDLDYRPYGLARSLRTKQSKTVGVLIPDNTNPYFAEMTRLLEDSFFLHDYNVIICNTEQSPEKELTYLRLLNDKAVDGVVFVSTGGDSEAIALLRRQNTPCILIDRDIDEVGLDRIVSDNDLGGYTATRHLIELGHRRIATVSGPEGLASTGDRLSGYSRAMHEEGLESEVVAGDFQVGSGYHAYRRLMERENPPTAVFAANDLMALGVLHGAAEAGVRVPQELSVVGFDDIRLASYAVPALTTVRQPKHEIVNQTVRRMLYLLRGSGEGEKQRITLEPRLVIRSSTAPPKE